MIHAWASAAAATGADSGWSSISTTATAMNGTTCATVANHAFSGAPWRLRRRMDVRGRPALAAARRAAAAFS